MAKHDLTKLPKWAQEFIDNKDAEILKLASELDRLRQAHAVLHDYAGWFTIHGPPPGAITEDGTYQLFFLSSGGAHGACSLKTGDVLLIGRKPADPS